MTIEVRNVYRPMANEPFVGQLRSRTWAMPVFISEKDGESPLWEQRCREYWERQEQLYGLRMSNFTNFVEPPNPALGKPAFITTYSVIEAILPGERHASMLGAN